MTSVTHKINNAKETTAKASKTPVFIFCVLSIAPLFNNKTPPCEGFPLLAEDFFAPKRLRSMAWLLNARTKERSNPSFRLALIA